MWSDPSTWILVGIWLLLPLLGVLVLSRVGIAVGEAAFGRPGLLTSRVSQWFDSEQIIGGTVREPFNGHFSTGFQIVLWAPGNGRSMPLWAKRHAATFVDERGQRVIQGWQARHTDDLAPLIIRPQLLGTEAERQVLSLLGSVGIRLHTPGVDETQPVAGRGVMRVRRLRGSINAVAVGAMLFVLGLFAAVALGVAFTETGDERWIAAAIAIVLVSLMFAFPLALRRRGVGLTDDAIGLMSPLTGSVRRWVETADVVALTQMSTPRNGFVPPTFGHVLWTHGSGPALLHRIAARQGMSEEDRLRIEWAKEKHGSLRPLGVPTSSLNAQGRQDVEAVLCGRL